MVGAILRFLRDEDGPTSVEYAVMLAMIAGVTIGSVLAMSNATATNFDNSATLLSGAMGGGS
ncbi:MAG: Flp family type IVb pilin [Lacipirellulaceae bacterium]